MNKNFITFFLILIFGLMFVGFINGAVVDREEPINVVIKLKNNFPQDDIKILGYNNSHINSNMEMVINRMERDKKTIGVFSENKNDFEVGYKYSNVNGFSAKVSLEKFEALKKDVGVESVEFAKLYFPFLDVSAPQIGANSVWDLQIDGISLNGTGQSICVIDTGVNYNHSALGGAWGNKVIAGYKFINNGDNESCFINNSACYDVEGHGTHVSGIVASENSTYKGIAPDSKIVIMQVFNGGGAWSSDIARAIDWCVDNKDTYNISVISMSLGDNSTHNTYCNEDYLASFIDVAVANDIAVVIAAGNCDQDGQRNCTIGVASPACVESAIIAGAVNDADTISFMRGALLELMAPGINIMSALHTGGYTEYDGTSMSAPHVAGAIALINQYLSLSGQTKTPQEIEAILNNTGKQINDSGYSNLNFSRIDVYSAILSLDIDAPNVNLIFPLNNSISSNQNQTFTCNATDWQLKNITFYLWNSSHEIINQTSFNISGTENQTSFNITNLSYGTYEWNCLVTDSEGNSNFALENYTLTIGGIVVNLISPTNNTYTNINETNFTCNLTSEETHELSNVTFYLWNSSTLIENETRNIRGTTNGTTFAYNLTEETNYNWNCLGVNNASYNSSAGNNFTIIYDTTAPEINLSEVATGTSTTIDFSFDVFDSNPVSNCSIYINGNETPNTSAINNSGTNTISVSGLSVGNHNAYINCTDGAGNIGNSSAISFTINSPPVTPSSSSGGGSSSTITSIATAPKVYEATISEITGGYTQKLKKNEKINFSIFDFNGGRHLLSVNEVGADYVDLTIESEPINLRLGIGQSAKLNLTSEIYYDLLVKLNSITDSTAELTIQLINEPVAVQATEIVKEEIVKIETIEAEGYFWLVIILVVVLISVLTIVIKLNRKKLKTLKPKKKHGKKRKKTKT